MSKVKIEPRLTVKIGDEDRNLKMTFGLLNSLVRTIGDIESVAEISFDNDLRDEILIQLFSERNEMGVITEQVNLFNLDIETDVVVDVLEWVGSHVADFLLKQMIRAKNMMEGHQESLKALTPT